MIEYDELIVLPARIQQLWQARLQKADPTEAGLFRLVAIRETKPHSFEESRIIVSVVDENGFPLAGVRVAFAYSTANSYILGENFSWIPPSPQRAFIVATDGSGQIDQIQGDTVKPGEPGGVSVFIFEPELYSSDVISGAGMLADHTGLALTFQLRRTGKKSIYERLEDLEARTTAIEAMLGI